LVINVSVVFNVRGLRGVVKHKTIKLLARDQKVDFVAIQETKMETVLDNMCYNLSGDGDCEWVFLPSMGNNGGIL